VSFTAITLCFASQRVFVVVVVVVVVYFIIDSVLKLLDTSSYAVLSRSLEEQGISKYKSVFVALGRFLSVRQCFLLSVLLGELYGHMEGCKSKPINQPEQP
jgi:hypothetical protein